MLMRVPVDGNFFIMLDILRKVQELDEFVTFSSFRQYIINDHQLLDSEREVLNHRLDRFESFIVDSDGSAGPVSESFLPGSLVAATAC
jgi:hypothetical protein